MSYCYLLMLLFGVILAHYTNAYPNYSDEEASTRIPEGHKPFSSNFAFQVFYISLFKYPKIGNLCGGSLISKKHILTAAHCLINKKSKKDASMIQGCIGSNKLCKGEMVKSKRWINHPNYDMQTDENDISIILIKAIAISSHISPIRLPSSSEEESALIGKIGVVSGFGQTKTEKFSSVLLSVKVKISPRDLCGLHNCPNSHICSKTINFEGPCHGDSGGPLVINKKLYGIISSGKALNPDHSKVSSCDWFSVHTYTSIIQVLDWIKRNTGIDSDYR